MAREMTSKLPMSICDQSIQCLRMFPRSEAEHELATISVVAKLKTSDRSLNERVAKKSRFTGMDLQIFEFCHPKRFTLAGLGHNADPSVFEYYLSMLSPSVVFAHKQHGEGAYVHGRQPQLGIPRAFPKWIENQISDDYGQAKTPKQQRASRGRNGIVFVLDKDGFNFCVHG